MSIARRAGRPARGSRATRQAATTGVLRASAALLGLAAGLLGTAVGLMSVQLARRVVTPATRVRDTRILGVDASAQTITIARTADTQLPGRYGLFTAGGPDYVRIGAVLAEDELSVTRKLLTRVDDEAQLAPDAAFSGWYFDRPGQLHLPVHPELIGAPVGPCPAWRFPAPDGGDQGLWAIHIHGRGTLRAETLRGIPLFHDEGFSSLAVSYRNDGDAPRSRSGHYALGATEWRDVEAAVAFAVRRGAERIVLVGWSMGGAIALQVALNSAYRERIVGVVLDSPVIDWPLVLRYQAGQLRVPRPVTELAIGALRSARIGAAIGTDQGIPFDKLDVVARSAELVPPILILHSDDDGFVPSDASHALAAARPDLVRLEVFHEARHTKLWNYDEDRWRSAISAFLRDRVLAGAPPVRGSSPRAGEDAGS